MNVCFLAGFFFCENTMSGLDLATVKMWLRVDHDDDDMVIEGLINTCKGIVETRLKRPLVGDSPKAVCKTEDELPFEIQWAIRGLVTYLYENRDADDDGVRARVLRNIALDRYINWGE